jgi:hypothetical protein
MTDEKRIEAVAQALCCGWECVEPDRCRCDSMEHDARMAIAALDDARDAEIARLRETLGGLHDALGLRREDHELRRDYGELGLDWIKRARAALNGGDDE